MNARIRQATYAGAPAAGIRGRGRRRAGPAGLCVAGDVAASSFLQYLMCMVHRYMAFTYIRIDDKLSEVPVKISGFTCGTETCFPSEAKCVCHIDTNDMH